MKKWKRLTAAGVALAVGVTGLEFIQAVPASAAAITLTCSGRTDDNTGPLGSSAAALKTMSKLGGSETLSLTVSVTPKVPAKVTPGAGAFKAAFDFVVSLPPDLIKTARDILALSSVKVTNGEFSVNASGAGSGTLSSKFAERTVDLTTSPVTVTETLTGTVTPSKSGKIDYRPGAAAMQIVIDKNVNGLQIGTLSVVCSSIDYIGSTDVQLPGAPNVAGGITIPVWAHTVAGTPLVGSMITPDNGNPILPNSLSVTAAVKGGYAVAGSGAAFFLAPTVTGDYPVDYSVCAAEKFTDPVPGVNQTQTITMARSTPNGVPFPNPHPIAMKLQFEGQVTDWIQLGYTKDLTGKLVPSRILDDPSQLNITDKLLGIYMQPTAAALQSALEKLPNIGAGNIKVTHAAEADPYTIEFVGALANKPHGLISVADKGWNSWLPSDGLEKALAELNGPTTTTTPGQTTTTTAPLRTVEQILKDPAVLFDWRVQAELGKAFEAQIKAAATSPANLATITAMFPARPAAVVTRQGLLPIASVGTGPLCSSFSVTWRVVANPFDAVVAGTNATKATTCKSGYTAKKVVVKVRKRVKVGKRYVYKTSKVTKTVCVKVKKTTTKKK